MIDQFTIVTKGGIALWSIEFARLKGQPVNSLIKKVLVQERGADTSFNCDSYTLKWTFANDVDLIFIVVYQKILSLIYIDELLQVIKRKFIKLFKDQLVSIKNNQSTVTIDVFESFGKTFEAILHKVEAESRQKALSGSTPKRFEETEKGKMTVEQRKEQELKDIQSGKKPKTPKKTTNGANKKKKSTSSSSSDDSDEQEEEEESDDDIEEKIEDLDLDNNTPKKRTGPRKFTPKKKDSTPTQKKGKEARSWDDGKATKREMESLNRSDRSSKQVIEKETEFIKHDLDMDISSDEEDKPVTGFMKYFQVLTGNRTIAKEDLEPVLQKFVGHLTSKNVALDIAEKLVESIGSSLEGKKLSTFQGVTTVVKTAMEESLTRILTPKKHIDILKDIQLLKGSRPYAIVFSGVNGVGKSTNLAKVCYWLKANGHRVMLAACDTFRSGAIEQLGTHAARLDVELFERGYGKDAASIAGDAIEYARQTKHDVVLIDTTGRMQNNEPLMRALSKLVNQNTIDLVLFVGEALVGNDGVDQLTKFDKSLSLLSDASKNNVRTIDGIILTKFDTIDDKVGAAISMVYSTGHPIIFLGTGQNYTDLKRMNVKTVVKTLLA
ncbi:signal recognition particle receptor alpha subunit [Cavenderia fasciculata]|uniref:Signal recognition particle receptor alpha subunit n=1 Tax=Cavenderia fasciculata TaxID=261658 RepID=F4QCR1_CACFS|nr:signal recognition particle receptor alpha subunit [Cavenderia fasciculata]EGG13643.1 signal recognition particle receptor alpha subunit [Cavenderia fasciculata]|eukprot:XP_004350347.1 signal recognition particle receptor alpha subunit [Cavenderia fasciculata]